jgi:TonB family protein
MSRPRRQAIPGFVKLLWKAASGRFRVRRLSCFPAARFCLCACLALLVPLLGQEKSVQVTEQELRKAATYKLEPEYPAVARQIRMGGEVELLISVDPNGQVEKVTVTRGNTLLAGPCTQAIKKWKFNPFRADGQAAHAVGPIKFSFQM